MNKWEQIYKEKLLTAEEIARQIDSNQICASSIGTGEPISIPGAIAERALKENLTGIKQYSQISLTNSSLWDNKELDGKFNHITSFCNTKQVRNSLWDNRSEYIPSYYHQIPKLVVDYIKPDVFYATVSPMDKHGYFSFGTSADTPMAMKKIAKKVFLEVNENMPRTHGNCYIHITEVDSLCEYNAPLFEMPSKEITEADKIIGDYIQELVPNEATIQLGIGGIPNAVAKALSNKRNLGIHTEMFTDSMIDLLEQGVVTNCKKNINVGKSIATFAIGSKKMYEYMDDNVGIEFHPVDYVNDPNIIGMNDNLISINSCLEVDLFGQVCSESIGHKHFSGIGGQVDFVRGAYKSKGGKSIIAINSTAKNGSISKIKPVLTPGSIVSTSRSEVDYISTEYGVVKLRGKSISERAKALISISHPDFREQLTFEAKQMNLF